MITPALFVAILASLVVQAASVFVAAAAADDKGRSSLFWFFFAAVVGPFAVLFLIAMPPNKRVANSRAVNRRQGALCPHCFELVHLSASVCPHCARDVVLANWERDQ